MTLLRLSLGTACKRQRDEPAAQQQGLDLDLDDDEVARRPIARARGQCKPLTFEWRYTLKHAFEDYGKVAKHCQHVKNGGNQTCTDCSDWIVLARDVGRVDDEQHCPIEGCMESLVVDVGGTLSRKGLCQEHGPQPLTFTTYKQFRAWTREQFYASFQSILSNPAASDTTLCREATAYAVKHAGVAFWCCVFDVDLDLPEADAPIGNNHTKTRDGILAASHRLLRLAMERVLARNVKSAALEVVPGWVRDCSRSDKISLHVYLLLRNRDTGHFAAFHNIGDYGRFMLAVSHEIEVLAEKEGNADAIYMQCHKRDKGGNVTEEYAVDTCIYDLNHEMRLDGHYKYGKPQTRGRIVECNDAVFGAKERFLMSLLTRPQQKDDLTFTEEVRLGPRMGNRNSARFNSADHSASLPRCVTAKYSSSKSLEYNDKRYHWTTNAPLRELVKDHHIPPPARMRRDRAQLQSRHRGGAAYFHNIPTATMRRVRNLLLTPQFFGAVGEVFDETDVNRHFALDLDDIPEECIDETFWRTLHNFVAAQFQSTRAGIFALVAYAMLKTFARCHILWPYTSVSLHEAMRLREGVFQLLMERYPGHRDKWAKVVDVNVQKMQCIGSCKYKEEYGQTVRLSLCMHVGHILATDGSGGGSADPVIHSFEGGKLSDDADTDYVLPSQCFVRILDDEPAANQIRLPASSIASLPFVRDPASGGGGGGGDKVITLTDTIAAAAIREFTFHLRKLGCPDDYTSFEITGDQKQLDSGVVAVATDCIYCPIDRKLHTKKGTRSSFTLDWRNATIALNCWCNRTERKEFRIMDPELLAYAIERRREFEKAEKAAAAADDSIDPEAVLAEVFVEATLRAKEIGYTGETLVAEASHAQCLSGANANTLTTTCTTFCVPRARACNDPHTLPSPDCRLIVTVDFVKRTLGLKCANSTEHERDAQLEGCLVAEWPIVNRTIVKFGKQVRSNGVLAILEKFPELHPCGVKDVLENDFRSLVEDAVHTLHKEEVNILITDALDSMRVAAQADPGRGCITFPLLIPEIPCPCCHQVGTAESSLLSVVTKTSGTHNVLCSKCKKSLRFPVSSASLIDRLAPQSSTLALPPRDSPLPEGQIANRLVPRPFDCARMRFTSHKGSQYRHCPPMTSLATKDTFGNSPTVSRHSERYVSDIDIPHAALNMCRSPMGTGKTYYFTKDIIALLRVNPNARVHIWAARVAYAENVLAVVNAALRHAGLVDVTDGLRHDGRGRPCPKFVLYSDRKNCPKDTHCDQQLLVITAQSASKLFRPNLEHTVENVCVPDLMVVDEIEFVAEAFLSSIAHSVLPDIWRVFTQCVRRAGRVMFFDAYLGIKSRVIADQLRAMEGDNSRHTTINEYPVAQGRRATVAYNTLCGLQQLVDEALCPPGHDPANGPAHNTEIVCQDATMAKAIYDALCAMFPDYKHKIALFTGSTESSMKKWLSENPNASWIEFSIIIRTHSVVGPGVDFSANHFVYTFQFLSGASFGRGGMTSQECAQGAYRSRNVPNMVIAGRMGTKGKPVTDMDTSAAWRSKASKPFGVVRNDIDEPALYASLECVHGMQLDETENNPLGYFLGYLGSLGFELDYTPKPQHYTLTGLRFARACYAAMYDRETGRYHTEDHDVHRRNLGLCQNSRADLQPEFFHNYCNRELVSKLYRIALALSPVADDDAEDESHLSSLRQQGRYVQIMLKAMDFDDLLCTEWHSPDDKKLRGVKFDHNTFAIQCFGAPRCGEDMTSAAKILASVSKTLWHCVGIELELEMGADGTLGRYRIKPGAQGQLLLQFLSLFGHYYRDTRTPEAEIPSDMNGIDVSAQPWFAAVYQRVAVAAFDFLCRYPTHSDALARMEMMKEETRSHLRDLIGHERYDASMAFANDEFEHGGGVAAVEGYDSRRRGRLENMVAGIEKKIERETAYQLQEKQATRAEKAAARPASVSFATKIPTAYSRVNTLFPHPTIATVQCVELSTPGVHAPGCFRTTFLLRQQLDTPRDEIPDGYVLWVRRVEGVKSYAGTAGKNGEPMLEFKWDADDETLAGEVGGDAMDVDDVEEPQRRRRRSRFIDNAAEDDDGDDSDEGDSDDDDVNAEGDIDGFVVGDDSASESEMEDEEEDAYAPQFDGMMGQSGHYDIDASGITKLVIVASILEGAAVEGLLDTDNAVHLHTVGILLDAVRQTHLTGVDRVHIPGHRKLDLVEATNFVTGASALIKEDHLDLASNAGRHALLSFLHHTGTDAAISLVFDEAAWEEAPEPYDVVFATAAEVLLALECEVSELPRGHAISLAQYFENVVEWAEGAGLALPILA